MSRDYKAEGYIKRDLGGDELHRLVRWELPPEKSASQASAKKLCLFVEKFHTQFHETWAEIEADCEEALSKAGFPAGNDRVVSSGRFWCCQENNEKLDTWELSARTDVSFSDGAFYAEKHADPFSEAWYAGMILGLSKSVRVNPNSTADIKMMRILRIGSLMKDWEWRHSYKELIVSALIYRETISEKSRAGGEVMKGRARERKARLKELALYPREILIWIGKNPKDQAKHLKRLAVKYDEQLKAKSREPMFVSQHGKSLSLSWFVDELADWRASGDINAALGNK